MAGFQMRAFCLLLLAVHQVAGIGVITFTSDLKKKKMMRTDTREEAPAHELSQHIPAIPAGAHSAGSVVPQSQSVSPVVGGAGTVGSTVPQGQQVAPSPAGGGAARSQDDSLSINMGGAARSDNEMGTQAYRPEAIHSEVCDTSLKSKVCTACTSRDECWHGVNPNFMVLNAPKGKVGFQYVASIWASCTKDQGYWNVRVEQLENANLGVHLNGKAVAKSSGLHGDEYKITHDEIGDNARIKIICSPNSAEKSATAKIVVYAMANKFVDTCMDRDFCLKKLGDGSAVAFELRNSNRRQYECLTGHPRAHLADVCKAFRSCFASQKDTNYEKELLQFLSAVFKKAPTNLVQTKLLGISSSGQVDEDGCTDPETADPESAECECLEEVNKQCAADGVANLEECFMSHLCASKHVCASWKTDAGCDSALLMRRSSRVDSLADERRSTDSGSNTVSTDLSLKGKCGSNEV